MHRIGHRQFPWQRGFFDTPQFYRHAYLYGQGLCAQFYAEQYDIAITDFMLVGFALYSQLVSRSFITRSISFESAGIDEPMLAAALGRISKPFSDARTASRPLVRSVIRTQSGLGLSAYQPSLLRSYPILAFGDRGERLRAPLVSLIAACVTSGLFYDLVDGEGHDRRRNEAAARFEQYAHKLLRTMLPELGVRGSHSYFVGRQQFDAPDIFCSADDRIALLIECKATKLSFGGQFADDPASEAERSYRDMSKAIFQLWRFFSHARRGYVGQVTIDPNASGMVLTLDAWLIKSRELAASTMAQAEALAATDPGILPEDRRPVLFCSIEELEATLANASAASFVGAVRGAVRGARDTKGPSGNKRIGARRKIESFP